MAFGQLDNGSDAQPMHEINVTPLVDVMLVLLVVFIITAPFLTHKIKLDLPKVSAQPSTVQQPVTVSLTKDAKLFVDKNPISREELSQHLQRLAASAQTPNVELRADGQVVYEEVVKILNLIQNAGITKIAFVTEPGGG